MLLYEAILAELFDCPLLQVNLVHTDSSSVLHTHEVLLTISSISMLPELLLVRSQFEIPVQFNSKSFAYNQDPRHTDNDCLLLYQTADLAEMPELNEIKHLLRFGNQVHAQSRNRKAAVSKPSFLLLI